MLILAPTGVASINVKGTTVHSALNLTRRGKFFPLESNALAGFRDKYWRSADLLDEISMVSKKVFYQMQRCLIEIFNLPGFSFAGRSTFLVGNILQLPPVRIMLVNTSSIDADHPENYVADGSRMFSFVELT